MPLPSLFSLDPCFVMFFFSNFAVSFGNLGMLESFRLREYIASSFVPVDKPTWLPCRPFNHFFP